jgi:hypothetical protein
LGDKLSPTYTIIGASTQIDKEPRLKELISKTISIGINYSAIKFDTDYIISLDRPFKEFKGNRIENYTLVLNEIDVKENELGYYSYTVTAAINYIYKQNHCSNVILVGIDHSLDGDIERYKDYDVARNIPYNRLNQVNTRNFIERHKTLNIIQTDLNSKEWNLPYITIEDILNGQQSINSK